MLSNLQTVQTTNPNENMNHMMSRKAPKGVTWAESESLDFGVAAAVQPKNEGHQYLTQVLNNAYRKAIKVNIIY